jgi:hypothetical protein
MSPAARSARKVVELYNLVVWNERNLDLAEEFYQSPMTLKDGTNVDVGSMEIFRVVAGKITEVWNCGYQQGVWS